MYVFFMAKDYLGILPEQYTGKELTVTATIELNDEQEAVKFFELAMNRLLDVNDWHRTADGFSATFQITDNLGKEVQRNVEKGDHLRIDIPGPGSKAGDGFDWVSVEDLKKLSENNRQSVGFRVRPSANPQNNNSRDTAHFYDSSATSNFIVQRIGNEVTALVIDKNLKPNADAESLTGKLRDAAIGTTALLGISKIQWQNLVDGIVKNENPE